MLIALHKNARTTPAVRACEGVGRVPWHHRADRLQVEEAR